MSAAEGAGRSRSGPSAESPAPLGRRLLSLIYETLLLAALLWCASLLFWALERELVSTHARSAFQLYIVLIAGAYFVWQWTHGGQTLPMKTWRMKLVERDGAAVETRTAAVRYAVAILGALLLGVGFFWAVFDREGQFLHDRIAGTRIVRV